MQPIRLLGRHGGVIDVRADEATEDVYRRLRPGLLRLANLLTGSEATAEDVVQDAFMGYQRNAAHVDNPDGYLRTSVVNLSRTAHRRTARERRHRPDVVTVTHIPEYDETWAVLRRLPYRHRAALVLRFYADMSEADIAAALGCRPGTVKSLVHRGLARVKEALA
ncbi:MAG TPA: sigma-70 family RNA polymerase sigma factor [Acidimicrobiales bacterium]|nr:sigma-70 family RNA polymerase sigma factor [Acidimicrobiales bacterium]